MKVIFFGSSSYCLPILESLKKNFNLIAVVTKPQSIVLEFAQKNNIPYFTPKDPQELLDLQDNIKQIYPDIAVVADYGMIIPASLFTIPKHKTLNIHFSKLPQLRGASPVQFTILMGNKSAWISVSLMDEGLDTGDIIWQKLALQGDTLRSYTAQNLYQKLFNLVSSELPDIVNKYVQSQLKPIRQDHTVATYTKILSRSDGFIPWKILSAAIKGDKLNNQQLETWPLYKYLSSKLTTYGSTVLSSPSKDNLPARKASLSVAGGQPTTLIERSSRAFSPFPGLWTKVTIKGQKKRLKILKANIQPTTHNLQLDKVQLEGKKPVSWKQFLEGHQIQF